MAHMNCHHLSRPLLAHQSLGERAHRAFNSSIIAMKLAGWLIQSRSPVPFSMPHKSSVSTSFNSCLLVCTALGFAAPCSLACLKTSRKCFMNVYSVSMRIPGRNSVVSGISERRTKKVHSALSANVFAFLVLWRLIQFTL